MLESIRVGTNTEKKLEKGRICGQMLDVSTDKGQLT